MFGGNHPVPVIIYCLLANGWFVVASDDGKAMNKIKCKKECKMSPRMQNLVCGLMGLAVAGLLFYGLMVLVFSSYDRKVAKIKKSNTRTVGTVIGNGGGYLIIEYHVYGIGYTERRRSDARIAGGQHYEVFYAEDDPQEN